jgi:hypothetical protein
MVDGGEVVEVGTAAVVVAAVHPIVGKVHFILAQLPTVPQGVLMMRTGDMVAAEATPVYQYLIHRHKRGHPTNLCRRMAMVLDLQNTVDRHTTELIVMMARLREGVLVTTIHTARIMGKMNMAVDTAMAVTAVTVAMVVMVGMVARLLLKTDMDIMP